MVAVVLDARLNQLEGKVSEHSLMPLLLAGSEQALLRTTLPP